MQQWQSCNCLGLLDSDSKNRIDKAQVVKVSKGLTTVTSGLAGDKESTLANVNAP
jgi:hypothetical protein